MTTQFIELKTINDQELHAAAGGYYGAMCRLVLNRVLADDAFKKLVRPKPIGPDGLPPEWTKNDTLSTAID